MDKFACDLLVHIAAPSNVKDDKRYAAIAQSVLAFQPLTTTRVIGHDPYSGSQSSNATDVLDIVGAQDPWPSTDDASSTWIQAHDDALELAQQHHQRSTEQQTFLTLSGQNLLQRSSGRSFSRVEHPLGQLNPHRPRTAPENGSPSFNVDMAFARTSRRRAHSEVSSFSNSFSTVPNSHVALEGSDLRVASDEIALNGDKFPTGERPSTTRSGPQRKKQRIENDEIADDCVMLLEAAQHAKLTFPCVPRTPNRPHSNRKPSSSEMESKSVSSTLSPSQPLKLGAVRCLPLSPHIPTVDLTTPLCEQYIQQGETVLEPSIVKYKSPVDNRLYAQNADQNHMPPTYVSKIRKQADEINGPNPPGGQQYFTTHITKTYELLSQRVSMTKIFRPTHVARDVRVLERGHWLFSIRMGTDDNVARSRRSLSQEERLAKLRHDLEAPTWQERVGKFDGKRQAHQEEFCGTVSNGPLWTEAEFNTFWENMSQFIQEGKAGWGSRLVREAKEDNLWEITFFGWGEVVGHAWLALWILSDKLIGQTPMAWVSGDGMVVVRMSGKKGRRESLGPWVRKGEGEFGYWGIGEDE
jgi:hypothetical protein